MRSQADLCNSAVRLSPVQCHRRPASSDLGGFRLPQPNLHALSNASAALRGGACVSSTRGSTVEARGAEVLHIPAGFSDRAHAKQLRYLRKGASERERLGLYVAAFHVFGPPALLFLEADPF